MTFGGSSFAVVVCDRYFVDAVFLDKSHHSANIYKYDIRTSFGKPVKGILLSSGWLLLDFGRRRALNHAPKDVICAFRLLIYKLWLITIFWPFLGKWIQTSAI